MRAASSRYDRMWVALPYALLALCAVLTWASGDLPAGVLPQLVLAGVAVVAWHGWWVVAHPQWLETRLIPMSVYFVGLVVLTDYLTALSFTFFPLYLVCYPMAFVALPGRWAYVGVGLTATVALLGPPLEDWTVEDIVIGLGAAVLVSVAGGSIRALEAETTRRRSAMAELARTHADLERALAENLALQDRLVAEARDAGVVAERTRLAGEIHDTLAAGLAGIISQLEALDAQLEPHHPLRARISASTELARESLQEARRSVRALRPGPMTDATLPSALSAVVARFERTHQIPVHFRVTGEHDAVPAPLEDALLRAAHEALTNVTRHAEATVAHVTLSYLGEDVALDISDDGVGFRPGDTDGGHGLTIMRERLAAFGGHVDVESPPAGGTTVTVTVPLTPGFDGVQR
ncbi:sensor histidine kinase [Agromyces sp. NPDC049794]|uniref:sensor histidine kinase n=1 Tax=unclassified Agromyces TaxID=2639701 RepID=UPI0033D5E151